MSPVEQELLSLPEHLSSPPDFSGVRVTRYLVLYVCFVDRCLSFCTFSFGHCVDCSFSIYGFWLPLWYLQILLAYVSGMSLSVFSSIYFLGPLVVLVRRYVFHYLAFQSFDVINWPWRLLQKRVFRTKLDIFVFIT